MYAMQYRLEEVGSEQRFIDNASPLRAGKNPFVCSRGSSQVLHENLCPASDQILLILHPKFREAVSIPRHHGTEPVAPATKNDGGTPYPLLPARVVWRRCVGVAALQEALPWAARFRSINGTFGLSAGPFLHSDPRQ